MLHPRSADTPQKQFLLRLAETSDATVIDDGRACVAPCQFTSCILCGNQEASVV